MVFMISSRNIKALSKQCQLKVMYDIDEYRYIHHISVSNHIDNHQCILYDFHIDIGLCEVPLWRFHRYP